MCLRLAELPKNFILGLLHRNFCEMKKRVCWQLHTMASPAWRPVAVQPFCCQTTAHTRSYRRFLPKMVTTSKVNALAIVECGMRKPWNSLLPILKSSACVVQQRLKGRESYLRAATVGPKK